MQRQDQKNQDILNLSQKWSPPPPRKPKCNTDASWHVESGKCVVGWLVRDENGNVLWYGAKAYPKLQSSLQAEATTLLWTMSCLDNLGFEEVIKTGQVYNNHTQVKL